MKHYRKFNWGYIPGHNCIYRLDPRIKLLAVLGLMLALFLSERGVLLVFCLNIVVIRLAQLPYKRVLRSIYTLKWLFIFTLVFHLFFTPGRYLFAGWGITYEGLINGMLICVRLMLLVVISTLLMLTTSPIKLTHGLESLLYPLHYLRVPVAELAMMIMLSLQFIPILLEEARLLFRAQLARGIEFAHTNIIHKSQNMLALLIPLILGAQRKAENVALSMQMRGYRGQHPRSRLHPLKFQLRDYLACVVVLGIIVTATF
jgi:energy-coupling factor transport system permease protein